MEFKCVISALSKVAASVFGVVLGLEKIFNISKVACPISCLVEGIAPECLQCLTTSSVQILFVVYARKLPMTWN